MFNCDLYLFVEKEFSFDKDDKNFRNHFFLFILRVYSRISHEDNIYITVNVLKALSMLIFSY